MEGGYDQSTLYKSIKCHNETNCFVQLIYANKKFFKVQILEGSTPDLLNQKCSNALFNENSRAFCHTVKLGNYYIKETLNNRD
jgi:hypothetical protein